MKYSTTIRKLNSFLQRKIEAGEDYQWGEKVLSFIKFLERYDGPPISQNEMEDRLGFQKKGGRIVQMTWAKMKYDVHVEQQSDPPDVRERSASPPPLLRSKRKSAMKKHSGNWSTLVAVKELEGRETTRTEVTELSARIFKKCNNGSPPTRLLQGANLRELIRAGKVSENDKMFKVEDEEFCISHEDLARIGKEMEQDVIDGKIVKSEKDAASGVDEEKLVQQLVTITGLRKYESYKLLEDAHFNINDALNMYFG
eukprot:113551_1